jgi:nuclear transport factor 2 (NTF2) superfamily protein/predicted N-acetyltransferase YhbS
VSIRPPVPPFTAATAAAKVQAAEDAWNTRDPERVAQAYTEDSTWRNRDEFLTGRAEIIAFLRRKWHREQGYVLRKQLWAFHRNRIAVRFRYEWHDTAGQWWRSYGNELWEFADDGLMSRREASINDVAITESERCLRPVPAGGSGAAAPVGQVRIEPHTGPRGALRRLFELAEDSADQLDSYLDDGRVLVARSGDEVVGHLQLVDTDRPGTVEIKNMAVLDAYQGRGIGARLVRAALELAGTRAATTVLVATAAADIGNLRFYQRQGFRLRSIEPDAFTPATGYPAGLVIDGIALRDRVWLALSLSPPAGDRTGRP